APLDMRWRNEQAQRRKPPAQAQKNCGENFLFTAMRTTAKQHRILRTRRGPRVPQGRDYSVTGRLSIIEKGGIIFDAACHTNSIAQNTERCPAVGIFLFWYANQVQKPEGRRDEKSKLPISSLRVRGQPRVDQCKRNATRVRF